MMVNRKCLDVRGSRKKSLWNDIAFVSMTGLILLLGPQAWGQTQAGDRRDPVPRIAIISAFEPELEKLRSKTEIKEVRLVNGRKHYIGKLEGHDVVLLLSGYSMVNAAMTTQALLDHFTVREIVFSGIAGGVNPGLHVGDVTVPAEWGQYQEQAFAREVPDGWDEGRQGKEFGNYGMMFPHSVSVVRSDGDPDKAERRFWFPADDHALAIARTVASKVKLTRCLDKSVCLITEPKVIVGGNGVSGPTFVDNAAYRQWVWQTFHADALDMETSAVTTVAYVNRVPFIAFRSLSDLAGGGGGKNEAAIFFKLAADNSAEVVLAYLEADDRQ